MAKTVQISVRYVDETDPDYTGKLATVTDYSLTSGKESFHLVPQGSFVGIKFDGTGEECSVERRFLQLVAMSETFK